MNNKDRIFWITRSSVFIALLIVLQAATAQFGNIFITGSVVNLILIVSVMTCGLATGITVAAFSPAVATLLGIGPLWILVPFIAAGNIALVVLWHYIGRRRSCIVAAVIGAVAKFLVLYIGIVRIAAPVMGLPEQQLAVISFMFSVPQLITALIGGVLATIILPMLKNASGTT